jgi:DNA-binding PadR family transcriptional regulator
VVAVEVQSLWFLAEIPLRLWIALVALNLDNLAANRGNLQAAVDVAKTASSLLPDRFTLWWFLGDCWLRSGDLWLFFEDVWLFFDDHGYLGHRMHSDDRYVWTDIVLRKSSLCQDSHMLRFAVLSLLIDDERSGYELAQLFDHSVGNFWHARHSQIYPAVRELETEGLVHSRMVEQTGRPDKVLYRATAAGEAALDAWVQQSVEPTVPKMAFSIRAFNLGRLPPHEAIALLESERAHHQQRLNGYAAIPRALRDPALRADAPFNGKSGWRYAFELGSRYEQMWIDWCNDIIERIGNS